MATPKPSRPRRHKLAGFSVTVVSLLTFALWVWPPSALLVTGAAGALYAWEWNHS